MQKDVDAQAAAVALDTEKHEDMEDKMKRVLADNARGMGYVVEEDDEYFSDAREDDRMENELDEEWHMQLQAEAERQDALEAVVAAGRTETVVEDANGVIIVE